MLLCTTSCPHAWTMPSCSVHSLTLPEALSPDKQHTPSHILFATRQQSCSLQPPQLALKPNKTQLKSGHPCTACATLLSVAYTQLLACIVSGLVPQTKQNTAQVLSPVHGMRCRVMLCCQWHIHSCLLHCVRLGSSHICHHIAHPAERSKYQVIAALCCCSIMTSLPLPL